MIARRRHTTLARAGIALVALALTFASVQAAAMAEKAQFSVSLAGHGDYTSKTSGHVTNNSGRCVDQGSEDTNFDFATLATLNVEFTKRGMSGDSFKPGNWDKRGRSTAELTKTSSGRGCHPAGGPNTSGAYDCTGTALPEQLGQSEFKLARAAEGERSRLSVVGPLFDGLSFSGSWGYETGSCNGSLSGVPLLQTMANNVPLALGLRVPIREKTLRNLRLHHYFKVDVGEGHYAPQVNDRRMCAQNTSLDTCKQTFAWRGRVTVKRTK